MVRWESKKRIAREALPGALGALAAAAVIFVLKTIVQVDVPWWAIAAIAGGAAAVYGVVQVTRWLRRLVNRVRVLEASILPQEEVSVDAAIALARARGWKVRHDRSGYRMQKRDGEWVTTDMGAPGLSDEMSDQHSAHMILYTLQREEQAELSADG